MTPWLTLLMPTLNGADYLDAALASIARERDPGVRIVAVDGGSTDGTRDVLSAYADRLTIEVHSRPDSEGWVWSTNLALSRAATPYCALLHQDDLWLPGRAATMRALTEGFPDADLAVGGARFVDGAGRTVGRLSLPWRLGGRAETHLSANAALAGLLVQNALACPAPVFRTEAARAVGGLDAELWYTADWDFWIKLAARGGIAVTPDARAAFRVHATSQTVRGSRDAAAFLAQMDAVLDRHGGTLVQSARTDALAAGRFSNRVNTTLAARIHGGRANLAGLAAQALRLGPSGLRRYLAASRLTERVAARLRAGLHASA